MRVKNQVCWVVILFFSVMTPCWSRTWTVGTGAGYDYAKIQSAIDVAQEGDTVVVAKGWYEESLAFRGRNITLMSTDPNNEEVVSSTTVGSSHFRSITLTGKEDANCVIRGLGLGGNAGAGVGGCISGKGSQATILQCAINGTATYGGGLHDCDGLIKDCRIEGCRVQGGGQGGGLYGCDGQIINCRFKRNQAGLNGEPAAQGAGLAYCTALIQGCTISENICVGQGAGLFQCSGIITQCLINKNEASQGAGLYGCSGEISFCTISGNTASDTGAGLYGCSGLISDCLIKDNQSTGWHGGGAALCENLVRCDISGNMARGYGGGAYDCNRLANCMIKDNVTEVYPGGGVYQARSVVNSLIMGNVSGDEGGACFDVKEINGCTIVGNYAANQGGALVYGDCDGYITNSIIWENTSGQGSQIVAACGSHTSLTIGHSMIQSGFDGLARDDTCIVAWLAGNLDVDPQFKDPGQWDRPGVWQSGEYHLLDTSPCINAGDPNFSGTDQNDVAGGARVIDGVVDMGAYEYEHVPVLLQHIVVTGPERVTYGQSVQYVAMAYYDDRSVADVTDLARWSVTPQEVAVIEIGELSLMPLDEAVQFMVRATYAEGGLVSDSNLVVHGVPKPGPVPVTGTAFHVDTLAGDNQNRGLSHVEAWATIQYALDRATAGDVIWVWPGVYTEAIRFKGKSVTLQSADDAAVLENPGGLAVSFIHGEGPGSVLKNFVIRHSVSGVFMAASSPTLANLTVVANQRGIECYQGQPTVTHCILWDNSELDVLGCSPQYTWLRINRGTHSLSMPLQDPGFVDTAQGDYHLKSQAGHWDTESDTWVADQVTSPCIDAGNWYSAVGREPFPNGGIVNQGAYGGTLRASKSYFGKPVCPVMMAGDINGDCAVDEWDMELLLLHWLEEFDTDIPTGGDR